MKAMSDGSPVLIYWIAAGELAVNEPIKCTRNKLKQNCKGKVHVQTQSCPTPKMVRETFSPSYAPVIWN